MLQRGHRNTRANVCLRQLKTVRAVVSVVRCTADYPFCAFDGSQTLLLTIQKRNSNLQTQRETERQKHRGRERKETLKKREEVNVPVRC